MNAVATKTAFELALDTFTVEEMKTLDNGPFWTKGFTDALRALVDEYGPDSVADDLARKYRLRNKTALAVIADHMEQV